MSYWGLGQDIRSKGQKTNMGCDKSVQYEEICAKDEPKFKNLLQKYCKQGGDHQTSLQKSTNFGFLNIVSDEETEAKYEVQECKCTMGWTDVLEIILIAFLALFLIRFLKQKFDIFQSQKKSRKMSQLQAIFSRLPSDSKAAMHPTAPVPIQSAPEIYPTLPQKSTDTQNAKPWLTNQN